jgi:hypothetical protein
MLKLERLFLIYSCIIKYGGKNVTMKKIVKLMDQYYKIDNLTKRQQILKQIEEIIFNGGK